MKQLMRTRLSIGIRSGRTRRVVCALAAAALLAVLGSFAAAQGFCYRNLEGKVLGPHDQPLNGAVVYLSNSRNNEVRTCITTDDGKYRFADLSDNTDYTVWAAWKGSKSSKRVLSSFDQRKQVYFDLHVSGKPEKGGA
jgi:hypothetical protein